MSILSTLRLVESDQVCLHEAHESLRLEQTGRAILADGVLRHPPLAVQMSDGRCLIVDGAHRTCALQSIGCRRIPVQVVDAESLTLEAWGHVVEKGAWFERLQQHPDLTWQTERTDEEPLAEVIDERGHALYIYQKRQGYVSYEIGMHLLQTEAKPPARAALQPGDATCLAALQPNDATCLAALQPGGTACLAALQPNDATCLAALQPGDAARLAALDSDDAAGRLAAWHQIVSAYSRDQAVQRVPDGKPLSLQPEQVLMRYPTCTLPELEAVVQAGQVVPAGVTRFTVQGRILNLRIPLPLLTADALNQREWEQLLQQWSSSMRLYSEPVYFCEA